MSQIAGEHDTASRYLDSIYAPIQREMKQFEEILERELRNDDPVLDNLVRYGSRLGGKRLRPVLVLLSAKASGNLTESHVVLAAVMEMIHTATLIHDDVLDEATLRRHAETVNARWNNEMSVLLGDYLFTHAFYLASTLESTYACRTIGRSTNLVCEGELRQTNSSGDFELSESDYFAIIEAKTAELCACCCRLGAHYSGADQEIEQRLGNYGRDLGIAFQIVDDLLDLQGDEATTGKSLGTDLEKCKPTLPLIHLLGQLDESQRAEVKEALTHQGNGHARPLMAWLERHGSLQYAQRKAEQYAQQAREHLTPLAPSESLEVLEALSHFVVSRRR